MEKKKKYVHTERYVHRERHVHRKRYVHRDRQIDRQLGREEKVKSRKRESKWMKGHGTRRIGSTDKRRKNKR